MNVSETIKNFLDLIDDCRKKYDWAYEQVGIEDKRTSDLLHEIEFTDDPSELQDLVLKLHESRKERRYYKDIISIAEKVNFWSERNEISLNYMREMLGRVRKEEDFIENRIYIPRVTDGQTDYEQND